MVYLTQVGKKIMWWFKRRDKRFFFRHPIHMPILLHPSENREAERFSETGDISLGGLRFLWPERLSPGTAVNIEIPIKEKNFAVAGTVAYSKQDKRMYGFQTGVTFTDLPSAFRAKLAEEMLEIMEYRKKVSEKLGVEITEEEAAKRWVRERAAKIPPLHMNRTPFGRPSPAS